MRGLDFCRYPLSSCAAAALLVGCGQANQNFVAVAVASAASDDFQALRDDAAEPSRLTHDIQGQWKPWFSDCYLFAQRPRPRLVCERTGGRTAQPEATRLLQYVRSSLPVEYRENKCNLGFDIPGTYCMAWSTRKRQSPLVSLWAVPGDGGYYHHTLIIYAPPRT
jgi:hypothetical protein